MKTENTFFIWIKAIACLAFAFALVLSPPSACHAASGMYGDHHTVSASLDDSGTNHAHDADSSFSKKEQHASISGKSAEKEASDLCCSGICLSVALNENGHNFAIHVAAGKYQLLHDGSASVEPSGFLRPPQFLI